MSTTDHDLALVYAFPDQSASFVHGYEAGAISARLDAGELVDTREGFPVHVENIELFSRMAAAKSLSVSFSPCVPATDGWINATFARSRPVLRIVGGDHADD